jgi:serine protease AprX
LEPERSLPADDDRREAHMQIARAISWNDTKKSPRGRMLLAGAVAASFLALPAASTRLVDAVDRMVSVIVRELPGAGSVPEDAVLGMGGAVKDHIRIIRGFVAQVPADTLHRLRALRGVASVTPDRPVRMLHAADGFDPVEDPGSLYSATRVIGARRYWKQGLTGEGVDVALIDTGVAPVRGLEDPGRVVNGPDLSFESQAENLAYLDTYGHGTHMAGIIAGNDEPGLPPSTLGHHKFLGVAPDARLVSLKVGNALGATDISQVIAAIDWVVQHRHDGGLDIRVLNLSFGTDGVQDYVMDPLIYAAEVAWRKGIVVVVAAGNSGFGTQQLNNPAYDPYVIAVGADDTAGTVKPSDDVVPEWSSRGNETRHPDLVAPGKSIAGLRVPGSYVDQNHPEGLVNGRYVRGSGTSQAAAVVSGAAALVIQQRPNLSPDRLKALLTSTAAPIPSADRAGQGAGLIDLRRAFDARAPRGSQGWPEAAGTGSLESARGSAHLTLDGVELTGEQDIFGMPWDGTAWAPNAWAEATWDGGRWNGVEWTGDCWCGTSWSRMSWSRMSWSRMSWSRMSWSGDSWEGGPWTRMSWSRMSWSRMSWSRMSWSSVSWDPL